MMMAVIKMKEILEKVKAYKQILVYRHVNPDLDAFGSQFGLTLFLKENFPDKHIVAMGDFSSPTKKLYPYEEKDVPDEEKSLAIIVDTANRERIDGDLSLAFEKIKIDHHLIVDQYGDLNIVDEKASSCAQVITSLYQGVEDDYTLSKEAASCLYLGIVGDSNRFLYRNTDERTFQAASTLLKHGVDIEALYKRLYLRPERDLQVTKFILNNYQVENKVAYYILKDEDLQTLQISREEGSNYVNTLANIEEFAIWVAVTENTKDHNVRVSIRSREVPINTIASAFHGGGHALASGATLSSFEELPALIKALGEAAASYQKDE